ncbi:MAG: phosphatase PAP2 family protein [Clostridia bacterium]|nr:phosphatase PAP2 family protein [Clostridia bacterium]
MAEWLNTAFSVFDGGVFNFMHTLSNSVGKFLTPVCKVYTSLGNGGIFFIILSIFLILFKKTRKTGFAMLLAIGIGAIFTNLIIKKIVARPRPYVNNEIYKDYWQSVGGLVESEFSFPSGHTTATTSCMMAMFLFCNKKWSYVGFLVAIFMAFTRVYLIVHYTTDVIAGLIIGAIAGTISFFVTKLLFSKLEKFNEKPFCNFALNVDICDLFKKSNENE